MEEHMLNYLREHNWETTLPAKRSREEAPVSYQLKIDLIEAIRELSEEEVAQFVEALQQSCPRAVNALPDDRLQIKVDQIDASTLHTLLDQYKGSLKKAKNTLS